MLYKKYLKTNSTNYTLALRYYNEYYYGYVDCWGSEPSFTFSEIEYFIVDNRDDGLTKITFYTKDDKELFGDLD